MRTDTPRRTIRPTSETAAPEAPARPAPAGMWTAWQQRLGELERRMADGLDDDLQRARRLPRAPDLAEARRMQATWQDPWNGLRETFEAATACVALGDALLRDYRLYLGMRDTVLRCLVRCSLSPSPLQVLRLDQAQADLDAFIAARRGGG